MRSVDDTLVGKRFRTKVPDYEEDEEFGEVMHPIGSEFVVNQSLQHKEFDPRDPRHGTAYSVAWQGTALQGRWSSGKTAMFHPHPNRKPVPAKGMWTIWTDAEIRKDAEEVACN